MSALKDLPRQARHVGPRDPINTGINQGSTRVSFWELSVLCIFGKPANRPKGSRLPFATAT